jgi:tetratricopeptide (TPR) repeat protein
LACVLQGCYYEKLNETEKAKDSYRKAMAIAPRFAYAQEQLTEILFTERAYLEIVKIIQDHPGVLPHADGFYLCKAYVFHDEEKYEQAAAAYKKVIRFNPSRAYAYLNLGILLHEELHRYDEARRIYRKLIQIKPDLALAYFQLGWLEHEHYRNYDEAESLFLKSLELKPTHETSLYNLACIKSIKGDNEAAFAYLEKAIEAGFDRIRAWNDEDLTTIRNDKRFIEIVGPEEEEKVQA